MGIMEHATSTVARAPRAGRRQAVLACAFSGYLALFAAAVVGVVSLFASTGGAVLALLLVAATAMITAAGLWVADTRAARGRPLASVVPIHATRRHAATTQHRAAG
jgi:hypothetical protein